jgi:DNA adenine methylase
MDVEGPLFAGNLEPENAKNVARSSVRPPLKWAGGKRWLLPTLEPLWAQHKHRRLVEPFCGGLAVAIGLMPTLAVLNDVNPHLVNFYRWLKRGLTISAEMTNDASSYYTARERFNELLKSGQAETAEAAGLFYYLNRTGYNGLCRFNRKGAFNVPLGSYVKIGYKSNFSEFKPAFSAWTFSNLDFELVELEEDDFVYADPPYDVQFTQYSKDGFDWPQQERAAEWFSKHKGPVVLSNQATPRIVKLYRSLKYTLKFREAPRRISCNGDRTPVPEVLGLRNI